MLIARTIEELDRWRMSGQGRIALVPTMGALHTGHLSLVAAARRQAERVAASVFVNPLQFDAAGDLARYPRDESADLALLRGAGCDLAWLPDVQTMIPAHAATMVEVAGPALRWEGAARPGHFRGAATILTRLFGQIRPDTAWFGEKDWQQLQVVRTMTADLFLPVRIYSGPTVREPDGLAMSSRNRFLSEEQRSRAPILYQTLCRLAERLRTGEESAPLLQTACLHLSASGFEPDYLAWVEADTLNPIVSSNRAAPPVIPTRLIAAARCGGVRLLDNAPV